MTASAALYNLARAQLRQRYNTFSQELRRLLPDAQVSHDLPDSYGLASTVHIKLTHRKDNRAVDFGRTGSGGCYANLTDDEKIMIGEAVNNACAKAGLDVLMKPSWSSKSTLCYRVFYKV